MSELRVINGQVRIIENPQRGVVECYAEKILEDAFGPSPLPLPSPGREEPSRRAESSPVLPAVGSLGEDA